MEIIQCGYIQTTYFDTFQTLRTKEAGRLPKLDHKRTTNPAVFFSQKENSKPTKNKRKTIKKKTTNNNNTEIAKRTRHGSVSKSHTQKSSLIYLTGLVIRHAIPGPSPDDGRGHLLLHCRRSARGFQQFEEGFSTVWGGLGSATSACVRKPKARDGARANPEFGVLCRLWANSCHEPC